jgi:hypothetical protein
MVVAARLCHTERMRAILRVAMLVLVAAALQSCAPGAQLAGCPLIPQKSEGACRVGLPTGWYGDDQWRTE